MKFLVDAQLPPALSRWLTNRGYSAEHVIDLPMVRDVDIWRHAKSTGAILISKDEDFALLSLADPAGPPLIWIRTGNATRRALISGLEPLLAKILEQIAAGEKIVEVV